MAVISGYPPAQLPRIGYHLLSQGEKQEPTFTMYVEFKRLGVPRSA
jgi:hypothetical protein